MTEIDEGEVLEADVEEGGGLIFGEEDDEDLVCEVADCDCEEGRGGFDEGYEVEVED